MVITGKPGAGKTLLISNLLNGLTEKQYKFFESEGLPGAPLEKALSSKIIVMQFNAMAYSMCFPLLLEVISQMHTRAGLKFDKTLYGNGTYLLEMFKLNMEKILSNNIFILVVDELDTLSNHDKKSFDLINDLLNINDKRFIKIGISNTLDLFAKYKNTKQYVECRQLAFKPYGEEDLLGILKERIQTAGKGSQNMPVILEDQVLQKVCKKLHKYAFGDIRMMLAVVKDIFERKLTRLKKEQDKNQMEERKAPQDFKISLIEAMAVIDEKYGDVQRDIIKTLSLPVQCCLLGLYFSIEDNQSLVPFVKSA